MTNFFDGQTARTTLLGDIEGVTYTLDGCYQRYHAPTSSERCSARWEIDIVYEGCRLPTHSVPQFTQMSFRIAHLEHWLGWSNIRLEVKPDPIEVIFSNELPEHVSLQWERPLDEAVQMPTGRLEVELRPMYSNIDRFDTSLSERALITYTPDEPGSLDDLLPMVGAVQQLLSLTVGRAAPITDLSIVHKPPWSVSEEDRPSSGALIYAPFRGSHLVDEDLSISSDDMLFSAERTSGAYLISQWLPVASKFQIAIDLLMTSRYLPVSDSRSRLAIASGAAEALYNVKFEPTAHVDFTDRLKTLAESVERYFHVLPASLDEWASSVKRDRTHLMHADPRKKHTNVVPAFRTHADDLEYLLMLCILREIDEDTFIAGLGRRPERRSGFSEQLDILTHRAPLSGRPPADLGR